MSTTSDMSDDAASDTPDDAALTTPFGVWEFVFLGFVVVGNLFVLAAAWKDRSWGALGLAMFGGPAVNGGFIVCGLLAAQLRQFLNPQVSLGRQVMLIIFAPCAAAVLDFAIIASMGLHGC